MRSTMASSSFVALALGLAWCQAAITGERVCQGKRICITGQHDSSTNTDTFTIAPPEGTMLPTSDVGWMAIGFGSAMINSPMVIMWPNTDGTVTLSQRQASAELMPSVVSNPPRIAKLSSSSYSNSTSTSLTFTVASNDDTRSNTTSLIWAMSRTKPSSKSPSAIFVMHDYVGYAQLHLTTPLDAQGHIVENDGYSSLPPSSTITRIQQPLSTGASSTPSSASGSAASPEGNSGIITTTMSKKALYAHVIFGGLATMLFFPLGAIIPRYARAFTTKRWWLPVHGVNNGMLGAVCVVVAFAIARAKFHEHGGFDTAHRKCGLVLFILTLLQVALGLATHSIKSSWLEKGKWRGKRPINMLHIILGITLLALGWATIYEGLVKEWPTWSGTGPAAAQYKAALAAIVGLSALLYIAGLFLVPRQSRLVKEASQDRVIEPHEKSKLQHSVSTRTAASDDSEATLC